MSRSASYFVVCLFLFTAIRGVTLSTTLMPFEGWDEYQHLAVASHVHGHGRMPTPENKVPRDMWDFVRAHPHPDFSAMQLWGLGVRNYAGKSFRDGKWIDAESGRPGPGKELPPELYQAQHGPLYYHLLSALRSWFSTPGAWADAARILNVLLAAIIPVLWFFILSRLVRDGPGRILPFAVSLMLAVNSLFHFNAARAANDSLAILFGTLALLLYVVALRSGPRPGSLISALAAATGVLVGLGVLAKSSVLVLMPLLCLGIFVHTWRMQRSPRAAVLPVAAFLLGYFAVAGHYHLECYQSLGTLTGMQEAVRNVESGKTFMDAVRAALTLSPEILGEDFLFDYLHRGGWSYLPRPADPGLAYTCLLIASAVFFVLVLLCFPLMRKMSRILARTWELALLLVLTWLGLIYHSAQSLLQWGDAWTNAWYGLPSFPALLFFLVLGACMLHRRLGAGLSLAYVGVFCWAYYLGTFVHLLDLETGGLAFMEALQEVRSHHALLDLNLPLCLAGEAVGLAGLLAAFWKSVGPGPRQRTPGRTLHAPRTKG